MQYYVTIIQGQICSGVGTGYVNWYDTSAVVWKTTANGVWSAVCLSPIGLHHTIFPSYFAVIGKQTEHFRLMHILIVKNISDTNTYNLIHIVGRLVTHRYGKTYVSIYPCPCLWTTKISQLTRIFWMKTKEVTSAVLFSAYFQSIRSFYVICPVSLLSSTHSRSQPDCTKFWWFMSFGTRTQKNVCLGSR